MSFSANKLPKELTIVCPLCSQEYAPENIRAVDEIGDIVLAHSECPHCRGAVISLLRRDMLGITLVGLVTDLCFNDIARFRDSKDVEDDDVLELYKFLNNPLSS